MNRHITITGVGKARVKPDLIVITMNLTTIDYEYEKTMQLATTAISKLNEAVISVGFGKKDLKTTRFNIDTYYENYRDKNEDYKRRFAGYNCEHGLKLEFDYDSVRLSQVLSAVAKSEVFPEISIQFTVKDSNAVSDQLLINATENAHKKAEILARAASAKLGELIQIDYSWQDIYFHSETSYKRDSHIMMEAAAPEIEPEDINVQDSVSFKWEII